MIAKLLKVGRWVVFVVGCGLFGVGLYLGSEGLIGAGAAMAGWATPWVMDAKLAKAAHGMIDLVAKAQPEDKALNLANTQAAQTLATVSKYPEAKAKAARKAEKAQRKALKAAS
jgi:hypothetical protein